MFSTSASIITCGEYIYSNSFRTQTLVPSFFPRGSSSPFTIFVKFGLLEYLFQKFLERSSVNTLRMYTLIQKITAVTHTRAREKQIPNQRCCVGGSARAPPKFRTLISDYHIWRYIFFNFSPFDNPRRRFSTKKIKVRRRRRETLFARSVRPRSAPTDVPVACRALYISDIYLSLYSTPSPIRAFERIFEIIGAVKIVHPPRYKPLFLYTLPLQERFPRSSIHVVLPSFCNFYSVSSPRPNFRNAALRITIYKHMPPFFDESNYPLWL